MSVQHAEIQVPSHEIPGGWVVGGMTRLLDVWSPSPLIMRAPAFHYPEHSLSFELDDGASHPNTDGANSLLQRLLPKSRTDAHTLSDSDIGFDCRHDSTENVAHVLQNQIAVAMYGLDALLLENRWRDLVFIVHKKTPAYAVELFKCFGMRVLVTDSVVRGSFLTMKPQKLPLRAVAAPRLREFAVKSGLLSESDGLCDPIFLSRRGRRSLENLDQIEPVLNKAGFRTIYAEDLPVDQQISILANSSSVFGLHGAALGYMMLRDPAKQGTVIESFSSGYATNWVRAICHKTKDRWVGVQGVITPETITACLNEVSAREHESVSYTLDKETVRVVLGVLHANFSDSDGDVVGELLEGKTRVEVAACKRKQVTL